MKGRVVRGAGEEVEIDGGQFGCDVKPANMRKNRRYRRLEVNQTGKRQCVVIVRARDGRSAEQLTNNAVQRACNMQRRASISD